MKTVSDIVYSPGKNDECWTPEYAVRPILKYVPSGAKVWCPFDTPRSAFVKLIPNVVYSHIWEGQSFFDYEPEDWDVIVSNPQFTGYRKVIERALDFGKPFALLGSMLRLNDKYPAWSFYERGKQMQMLKYDRRIIFENHGGNPLGKMIPFNSGYYAWNFFPKDLVLEELPRE